MNTTVLRRSAGTFYGSISPLNRNCATDVVPGHVLEIAADYFSSSGNRHPCRQAHLVLDKTEGELVLARFETVAQAMQARRAAVKNGAVGDALSAQDRLTLRALADAGGA